MIRPRHAALSADPALLAGVLGAAAMLGELRAILAGLAEDGDRAEGDGGEGDGGSPDGEVVDVVLGLAALADLVTRRLPEDRGPPGTGDGDGAPRAGIVLAIAEVLR